MIVCKDYSVMNDLDATLQQVALPLAIVGYVQNDEETINGIIQTNPNVTFF